MKIAIPKFGAYHAIVTLFIISAVNVDVVFFKLEHLFFLLMMIVYSSIFTKPRIDSRFTISILLIIFFGFLSSILNVFNYLAGDWLFLLDQFVEGYVNLLLPIMFIVFIAKSRLSLQQVTNLIIIYLVIQILFATSIQLFFYKQGEQMPGAFTLALLIPLLLTNYRSSLIWLMSLVSLVLFINAFSVYLSRGILVLTFISLLLSLFFYFGKFKASVILFLFLFILVFVFTVVFPISGITDIERLYEGIEYLNNIFNAGLSIDDVGNLEEYGSTEARAKLYLYAIVMNLSSSIPIILGTGPGMFDYLSISDLGSHSSFFGFLSEYGMLAILLNIYIGYIAIQKYKLMGKYNNKRLNINIFLFSILVIYLSFVNSFFESSYFFQGGRDFFSGNLLLFLLLGYSFSNNTNMSPG